MESTFFTSNNKQDNILEPKKTFAIACSILGQNTFYFDIKMASHLLEHLITHRKRYLSWDDNFEKNSKTVNFKAKNVRLKKT